MVGLSRRSLLISAVALATTGTVGNALSAAPHESAWAVVASGIDPETYHGATVANGMIGLTSSSKPFHTGQTLINGVYEPMWDNGFEQGPTSPGALIKTFNLLDLNLAVNGTSIDSFEQVTNFKQQLDFRRAVLTTSFDFAGKLHVEHEVRALRHLPHVALANVRIHAIAPVEITVRSMLDGSPSFEAPALRDVVHMKNVVELESAAKWYKVPIRRIRMAGAQAYGPTAKTLIGAAHSFVFGANRELGPPITHVDGGLSFSTKIPAGRDFSFGLVGATLTSQHVQDPVNEAFRLTANAVIHGEDDHIARHEQAWQELWKSDIRIQGDHEAQRQVHAMLYNLYSSIRRESGLSIAPMGLTRNTTGYLGHIFWDSEIWTFPVLVALHPELARTMLDYRFERLDAAKANATRNGYRGAQYPWESAGTGAEDTWSAVLTGPLQVHISAAIAMAAWNYYRVTKDVDWLRARGWPMIEGTAEFWTSRVTRNGPGRYDIEHVVASDEYAEDVENDAYTNAAARENLAIAIKAASVLGLRPNPDWAHVRQNIPILRFKDGVTREHSTYNGQAFKVADVNLLAYPLKEVSDPTAIRRDLEYYSARIDHATGPAMLKSVLAIIHQRLGDHEVAYNLFRSGYEPNLRPPFGVMAETATSQNPYFITGAGGLLQTLIYGFGGMELDDDGLHHRPGKLPKRWKSLKLMGVGPEKRDYVIKQ